MKRPLEFAAGSCINKTNAYAGLQKSGEKTTTPPPIKKRLSEFVAELTFVQPSDDRVEFQSFILSSVSMGARVVANKDLLLS